MHDLYIEKKKNLDEDELTIWMEECNTQNRAKEEAGDVIKDWLTDYQRYGKDDVRQANARKRDVHRRRETQYVSLLNGFPTPLNYVRKQDPQYGYGTGLLRCILVARFLDLRTSPEIGEPPLSSPCDSALTPTKLQSSTKTCNLM